MRRVYEDPPGTAGAGPALMGVEELLRRMGGGWTGSGDSWNDASP